MSLAQRATLAFIGGFRRPPAGRAQGTHQAAYLVCQGLAAAGRYRTFDLYQDQLRSHGDLVLPAEPPTRVFEKTRLQSTRDRYAAIYVANGEQIFAAPHVLRPPDDWAPVVCSVGTAHANGQWSNLFLSLASGAIRGSDGFIFKSKVAEGLFRAVWTDWSERYALPPFPALTAIIPNGVDVQVNRRSEALRAQTRQRFRVRSGDVVYLSFARLDPGMKGDLAAVILRWRQVVAKVAQALLVLAGATADRAYVTELRRLAQAAGIGDRVLIIEDPHALLPDARASLMSAADAFIHAGTGIEEVSPLVVREAQAHALPVIATRWAGLPEIVEHGATGFLYDTRVAPVRDQVATTLFGETDRTHLVHAGHAVWCDWSAFVAAAVALADQTRRDSMGAAARRQAESHDLPAVSRAHVAFFDAVSAAAEAAWAGPATWRPLIDLNDVIAKQSAGRLEPRQRVRLGDAEAVALLTGGLQPESTEQLARVMDLFRSGATVSVADVAAAAAAFARAAHASEFAVETDLAISSRLLIRLLNCGVLELDPGSEPR